MLEERKRTERELDSNYESMAKLEQRKKKGKKSFPVSNSSVLCAQSALIVYVVFVFKLCSCTGTYLNAYNIHLDHLSISSFVCLTVAKNGCAISLGVCVSFIDCRCSPSLIQKIAASKQT